MSRVISGTLSILLVVCLTVVFIALAKYVVRRFDDE